MKGVADTGGTGTPMAARQHARAQAGTVVETMATIPASTHPDPPAGVDADALTWAEVVAGGGYTSKVISRGTTLRLTDLYAEACAHVLLYNADQPWERLNVADTVKVPWQAYLTAGHPLLSDQGRVLATLLTDTRTDSHDALAGASTLASNTELYGAGAAHTSTPATREMFKLAAAKHDLGLRDVGPSVSFFKSVRVQPTGGLRFLPEAAPGAYIELRAELPLIVLIANAPHRLDPRPRYTCSELQVLAWRGEATQPDDPLWTLTPELERALLNTYDYATARGSMTDQTVEAQAPWSGIIRRGEQLAIVDLAGNQAVDFLVYGYPDTTERYSFSETIAAQGNLFLTTGSVLRSAEGAALMTIVDDQCGRHDTVGGACSKESNTLRYGHHTRHQHACVENFLTAGAPYGLGKRDLVPNVNWFMNVPVEPDGTLGIVDGISAPGLTVTLRADRDVLVLVSNCPQINNPCNGFDPTPIRMVVSAS